ncbi:MAG: glutathione S-transferase family protein [Burkholderiaceae bacterium]|jgi:glutathione S-transferase|nr:glutathione S-transferase family protein [Burkholderiaceae bacterium]
MIELHYGPGACSFVPHAALEVVKAATGQDFVAQVVKLHKGEQRTPEYLALNPNGQVPTLVVDGQPLTQIVAICDWLDRRFPQAGLLPTESWARAQAMSRFAWMNNTVHPTFTHVFMPERFTDDEAAQQAIKAFAIGQFRKYLERIQQWTVEMGDGFLLGERLSFLDIYSLTLLRWGGFAGIDPESLPRLWAHVQRVAQVPAVAAAIERERLKLNVYRG